jgi:glycosyltransferase involved in cell wall biosynthesis
MSCKVHYISRRRKPNYHSIEELFGDVSDQMKKHCSVEWTELPHSGASPVVLLKNLAAVKPQRNITYHITGDVNYMSLRLGKKTILTIHDVKSALKGSFLKQFIIKWLWFKWPAMKVKYITVISEFSKKELVDLIPRQANKINVIYNPVHTSINPDLPLKFNTNQPTILLVGTKSNKNIERTIEAIKDLKVKLNIIGMLKQNQIDLLNKHDVDYINQKQLSFDEVIACYKMSDLVCFPSLYEGFGMPIIEAQATGRPVITSNIGTMKEIAGDSACLVDPNCVTSIREGVIKVINDEVYRDQLVKKGLENIQRFKIDVIAEQYAELYKKIQKN